VGIPGQLLTRPPQLDYDLDVAHLREVVVPLELRIPRPLFSQPQRGLQLPVLGGHGLQVGCDLATLGHQVVVVVVLLLLVAVKGRLLLGNVRGGRCLILGLRQMLLHHLI
jgi:hypothetical protein